MSLRTLTDAEQTRLIDRWKMVSTNEADQRANDLADLEFEGGAHWDPVAKAAREAAGKPCFTVDLLSGTIKQVTNQARSARPGIVVTPRGNGATKETAQIWQAILRRIETNSNADYAYTWANQHQVKMGHGYWRILPYFPSQDSDEQDIKIAWIDNQQSVFLGPATEPDGSDRKWAFIPEKMLRTDYIARFGESASITGGRDFSGIGAGPAEWLSKDTVTVVEYLYIEESTKDRHTLSDGTYVFDDMLKRGPQKRDKGKYAQGDPVLPKGLSVKRTRKIATKTVKWCLLNGAMEVLEETIIPGQYIPIVEIIGERRNIDGKVDKRGMVRMAKGPAITTDYLESTVVEIISIGTKSRWLIAEGQTEDHEDMWATANRKNWDSLIYKEVSVGGTVVGPPIPIDREPPIQATVEAAQRAAMQQRAILGYVDVQADEQGPQGSAVSGRAISARKLQQEMQSSDYMDGLGRGVRLTAKIAHSMARDGVYETPRILRVIGVDEKEFEVLTHAGPEQQDEATAMHTDTIKHVLDITAGDYDFAFSPGKSFQSQRQEATDAMTSLFSADPELVKVGGDIWIGSQDWPGAQELAARLKKANPLAQDDDQQQPLPPKVQQRLQSLDQYAQAAHEQIQQLNQIIAAKQLELQSAEKIAAENNDTKLEIAQIAAGQKTDVETMKAQLAKLADMVALVHEERMQHSQQAHEVGLAHVAHHHKKEELTAQAVHGALAAEQGQQHALQQGQQAADLTPQPEAGA